MNPQEYDTLCYGMKTVDNTLVDCKIRHHCKRFTNKGVACNQVYLLPPNDFSSRSGCGQFQDNSIIPDIITGMIFE
jgi:hypothetical protein